jgi:hypothetical protein
MKRLWNVVKVFTAFWAVLFGLSLLVFGENGMYVRLVGSVLCAGAATFFWRWFTGTNK